MKRPLALLLCAVMVLGTFVTFGMTSSAEHEHDYVWQYPCGSSCSDKDRTFIHVCTVCGDVDDTKIVPAGEHTSTETWEFVSPATIDSEGIEAIKCANCDEYVETRTLPKLRKTDDFNDVSDNAWYAHAVSFCYAQKLFSGVNENMFAPDASMTRAMFVTVAASFCGIDRSEYDRTVFDDVPAGEWYTASVTWAAENGIVSGVGNGKFAPTLNITREQAAAMLLKLSEYLGIPAAGDVSVLNAFSDKADVSGWAENSLSWAVHVGLIGGFAGKVTPLGTATRSQVAQIMMNFFNNLYLRSLAAEKKYLSDDRYLMVEGDFIDDQLTTAQFTIHSPEKQEQVFNFNAGWEYEGTVYHNIVKMPDGTYRMYYKATSGRRRIAYIESTDGLTWTRPVITAENDYFTDTNCVTGELVSPDNMFVFYDENPNCLENEHIKGVYGQWGDGLFLELSTNDEGKEFQFWTDDPDDKTEIMMMGQMGNSSAATGGCFFDSLNTVHWDAERGKYVAFVRGFHQDDDYELTSEYVDENPSEITRDIRFAESDDCYHWSTPVPLKYSDDASDSMQMYANAITPYFRSKELYVGIPTRYNIVSADPVSHSVNAAYTDNMLMVSRDLVNWTRYDGQYMLPFDPETRDLSYGDCYPCVGMIETSDGELSLYMKENVTNRSRTVLYRYSLRVDGFASCDAADEMKTVVTKPVSFMGSSLTVNAKTGEGGSVVVKIADNFGNSIESKPITGDVIDGAVEFDEADLASFQSKEVRVTFELTNAELYSFMFN